MNKISTRQAFKMAENGFRMYSHGSVESMKTKDLTYYQLTDLFVAYYIDEPVDTPIEERLAFDSLDPAVEAYNNFEVE